ncbi:molybdopterin-binding protein [Phosphitispora sp. TUW77]|uniref:molybdopterin-binding protein n=1 Tax=Phosphitispora sp. TUW77 TaxID=3152361 RepID=UPI003AB4AD18
MVLKKVRVENSIGMVLAHDITQIVPGIKKGPLFRKGHVVEEKDIPQLLNIGKEHLYLLEQSEGLLHEDDAAIRLANAATGKSPDFEITSPKEGRVNIKAAVDGLLKINVEQLVKLNSLGEIVMATLHSNRSVRKGDIVGGTRIIPLLIKEENITVAEKTCAVNVPLIKILPYMPKHAGIIITGSEIKKGRITDKFGPVVKEKLAAFDVDILISTCIEDNSERISAAIKTFAAQDVDMVIVTGGMSVDPDDVTPRAIKATGARIVSYGVPVLPGAMFMLAYLNDKPVMGLPGCVMYSGVTVFDLILPRILAGEIIDVSDVAVMGHGGLCLSCVTCSYPNCALGKGV